jgi:hypothetical protein
LTQNIHDVGDLAGLLARVRAALTPGGALVFSVEHPIYTAPASPGWSVDAAGRTIATYVNLLIGEGLAISHLDEWGPSEDQIVSHPEWANERQRPPFLLVGCRRGGG